jgi:hypothetical protein
MDIASEIASKLGVKQDQAQGIVGTVLGALRKEAPADVGQAIDEKVPEAKQWAPSGGGGGLGGMLGGALGGGGGAAAGLLSSLSRFGVDAGQLGQIVPKVLGFLRERIGPDKVEKLASSVPFLKQSGQFGF